MLLKMQIVEISWCNINYSQLVFASGANVSIYRLQFATIAWNGYLLDYKLASCNRVIVFHSKQKPETTSSYSYVWFVSQFEVSGIHRTCVEMFVSLELRSINQSIKFDDDFLFTREYIGKHLPQIFPNQSQFFSHDCLHYTGKRKERKKIEW